MIHRVRRAFTLVELMIVVVIVGVLASIAIPKFASLKEKAYLASMKSDLRLLVSVQENYFADNNTYAISPTALGTSYAPSPGVSVQIHNVSASGWTGIALHGSTAKSCMLIMGGGSTTEGTPVCQ